MIQPEEHVTAQQKDDQEDQQKVDKKNQTNQLKRVILKNNPFMKALSREQYAENIKKPFSIISINEAKPKKLPFEVRDEKLKL